MASSPSKKSFEINSLKSNHGDGTLIACDGVSAGVWISQIQSLSPPTYRGTVMSSVKFFFKAISAAALTAISMASQAYVVTIAPAGSPLNCTALGGNALTNCAAFQADSVVGSLGSQLQITNYQNPSLGGSLGATYHEVGQISLDVFKLGSANTKFGGVSFNVWATFTLDGGGFWGTNLVGDTVFTAASITLSNAAVYGSTDNGVTPIKLADLTLAPVNLAAVANVTQKSSSLSASFNILPVAGSVGPTGFFQSPTTWDVNLFSNNVGFGIGTGVVTPNPLVDGAPVYFTTNNFASTEPHLGGSGSFNGAFTTRPVPEPASLALVGLALVGVVAATRRSKSAQR